MLVRAYFHHSLVVTFMASLMGIDGAAAAENPWSQVKAPAPGPAGSMGGYSSGCLAGGVALAVDDGAYDLLRPQRHRHFGHPVLLDFVRTLAARIQAEGLGRLRVGDLGQPRGGPAPSGHASHQIGLDVDLAFLLTPRPTGGKPLLATMVDREKQRPLADFGDAQRQALRFAASDSRVARIFVNPVLKRALCEPSPDEPDRAWREKIRPWWGHDEHFHVRLSCPEDSPLCRNQAALPAGEGCDELSWWFEPKAAPDRSKAAAKYGKRIGQAPGVPDECALLVPPERHEPKVAKTSPRAPRSPARR